MHILGMFEKPRRIDFREIMEEQALSCYYTNFSPKFMP